MNLRPLGARVLIKPESQPEMSESGLIHLVEHKKPEEMGTVVAVGYARHPRKDDAEALADWLEYDVDSDRSGDRDWYVVRAKLVRDLVRKEPCVQVGDTVLFSWASGQELTVNDGQERYLLLREEDLLAVLEE